MKNFVQRGDVITVPAPSGGVLSGSGVLVGSIFGISTKDAAETTDVELEVTGVYQMKKTSALAIAIGDKVYWDNTNKEVNKTASGNTLIGVAVTAAVNPSPVVNVRLNAQF